MDSKKRENYFIDFYYVLLYKTRKLVVIMSKILFTDAQVNKISKNKQIKNITNKGITYTDEFKYKLVKECENYKKFPQDVLKIVVLIQKQLELYVFKILHTDGENS